MELVNAHRVQGIARLIIRYAAARPNFILTANSRLFYQTWLEGCAFSPVTVRRGLHPISTKRFLVLFPYGSGMPPPPPPPQLPPVTKFLHDTYFSLFLLLLHLQSSSGHSPARASGLSQVCPVESPVNGMQASCRCRASFLDVLAC